MSVDSSAFSARSRSCSAGAEPGPGANGVAVPALEQPQRLGVEPEVGTGVEQRLDAGEQRRGRA